MERIDIKLEGGIMPKKGSGYAAAYDLYCPVNYELTKGRQVIDLGFRMALPRGKAALIQPRSGFSSRGFLVQAMIRSWWLLLFGIGSKEQRIDADVIIGLVDEDYRGHTGVIIDCRYSSLFRRAIIPRGTRIAQMRIVDVPETELKESEELDMSNDRGGGFGHTGA